VLPLDDEDDVLPLLLEEELLVLPLELLLEEELLVLPLLELVLAMPVVPDEEVLVSPLPASASPMVVPLPSSAQATKAAAALAAKNRAMLRRFFWLRTGVSLTGDGHVPVLRRSYTTELAPLHAASRSCGRQVARGAPKMAPKAMAIAAGAFLSHRNHPKFQP
jgi:hypothetical protein